MRFAGASTISATVCSYSYRFLSVQLHVQRMVKITGTPVQMNAIQSWQQHKLQPQKLLFCWPLCQSINISITKLVFIAWIHLIAFCRCCINLLQVRYKISKMFTSHAVTSASALDTFMFADIIIPFHLPFSTDTTGQGHLPNSSRQFSCLKKTLSTVAVCRHQPLELLITMACLTSTWEFANAYVNTNPRKLYWHVWRRTDTAKAFRYINKLMLMHSNEPTGSYATV